jgi:hypothetical protein
VPKTELDKSNEINVQANKIRPPAFSLLKKSSNKFEDFEFFISLYFHLQSR